MTGKRFSCTFMPYLFLKLEKVSQLLLSAAVVIGALRVKFYDKNILVFSFNDLKSYTCTVEQ